MPLKASVTLYTEKTVQMEKKKTREVFYLFYFWEDFVWNWYCLFLKYFIEFASEAIYAWNFFCEKVSNHSQLL